MARERWAYIECDSKRVTYQEPWAKVTGAGPRPSYFYANQGSSDSVTPSFELEFNGSKFILDTDSPPLTCILDNQTLKSSACASNRVHDLIDNGPHRLVVEGKKGFRFHGFAYLPTDWSDKGIFTERGFENGTKVLLPYQNPNVTWVRGSCNESQEKVRDWAETCTFLNETDISFSVTFHGAGIQLKLDSDRQQGPFEYAIDGGPLIETSMAVDRNDLCYGTHNLTFSMAASKQGAGLSSYFFIHDPFPSDIGSPTLACQTTAHPDPSTTNDPPPDPPRHGGGTLARGTIAGVTVGACMGIILLVVGVLIAYKRRRLAVSVVASTTIHPIPFNIDVTSSLLRPTVGGSSGDRTLCGPSPRPAKRPVPPTSRGTDFRTEMIPIYPPPAYSTSDDDSGRSSPGRSKRQRGIGGSGS